MALRLIIFALTLYAMFVAPCRLSAAEPPRAYTTAPPPKVKARGDACACPAGACPSRCPVVKAGCTYGNCVYSDQCQCVSGRENCKRDCPAVLAPAPVQYQLYQVTQGRRTWYEYRIVSGATTAASDCPDGRCPLRR